MKPLSKVFTGILFFGILSCTEANAGDPTAEVEIFKFKFIPQEVTVKAGEAVRWTNVEKRQYHSVWFEAAGDPEAPYLFPGETTIRIFDKPGEYPYHCGPHPEMTGIVHVQ